MNKENSKILIMMSTYNGELFLREQLDSILAQEYVDLDIFVRDDGSEDGTIDILNDYVSKYSNISFYTGENKGYRKSFYSILSNSNSYSYYAFADQDDFWEKNKLYQAILQLKQYDKVPALYCSNLKVVDENLSFMRMLHSEKESIVIGKSQALVENFSYGCTCVFNHKLAQIAKLHEPKYVSHDGWINLIAVFFGVAIYDNKSYIKYRQHGKNTLGGDRSFVSTWTKRINSLKKLGEHHRDLEAKEFLDAYSEMLTDQDKEIICTVSDYRKSIINKLRLFFNRRIRMSTFDRDFWYRVRVLLSVI